MMREFFRLRRVQRFSRLLTFGAESGFWRSFETGRFDRIGAANAEAVSSLGDPNQRLIDARRFIRVPVRQIIEQMNSAVVRCAIDPVLVLIHRALFFLHVLEGHHDFIPPVP